MEPGRPGPGPDTPDRPSEDASDGSENSIGFDASLNGQWQGIHEAIEQAGLGIGEVWLRYFSFSGEAGEYEIDAYLHGSLTLSAAQADLLAHAVNELIDETPRPRAPYSREEHQDIEERRKESRQDT
jgi:hypothetical protein